MAKAYAGDAGFRVAASALQVHGGIGFTYEHDLHFFLRRVTLDRMLYGAPEDQLQMIGDIEIRRAEALA